MKLSKDAVITKCGECKHIHYYYKDDSIPFHEIGNVDSAECTNQLMVGGSFPDVNSETLSKDCPLQTVEVIEVTKNMKEISLTLEDRVVTLDNLSEIDKIIIVKKGDK